MVGDLLKIGDVVTWSSEAQGAPNPHGTYVGAEIDKSGRVFILAKREDLGGRTVALRADKFRFAILD